MNIEKLKLTSPLPPSVNHYLSYRAIIKNGKPMAMAYKTQEATKYQKDFSKYVIEEVKKQNYSLKPNKTQHFYIDAIFYFDRIDKDPNNYWKCMLDAITDTGLIWLDDNVTCERVNRICYDTKNPRIELEIYPVSYIGVFNNTTQLDEFISNCIGCSRYKRNCSILQKAKEGRIQDEIQDLSCSKFVELKEK
jgi:crossover junction endodeoxyribonuclease RusA